MLSHGPILLPVLLAAASVAFALTPEARAGEQRLSGPYTHDNLTIFLVHGASAQGPVPLTLEEALDKGLVKVHETGSVGELEIENTGDEEVFVHAGDIVKGGQQDRVVTATMIMKGRSGRLPLNVFCVEAGRWSARGAEDAKAFSSSKEMLPTREAKLAMKSRYTTAAAPPVEPSAAAAINRRLENEANPSQSAARDPQRENDDNVAGFAPDPQSEVWRNVSRIQSTLTANLGASVASDKSETSLQLALENEKLAKAQKAYIDALEGAAEKAPDVVGYVQVVNGRIASADIYASNALFRKLWPRLLKAAATEAIGAEKSLPKAIDPTSAAVDEFLATAASGKPFERPLIDGQRLETREAATAVDFETRSSKGDVVHRNVLAR